MTKLCLHHIVCLLVVTLWASPAANAEPLHVAPGSDPGGTPVAIITSPFPLGSTEVSEKLARDGEGVAIGWDFSKRPKSSESDAPIGTAVTAPVVVAGLTGIAETRLVATFIDRLRPATWAQAIAFVAQTPARIVVVPFATNVETDWVAFRTAAEHFPNLLFIVPAQTTDNEVREKSATPNALGYPAKFHLSNVLSISATNNPNADINLALPSNTSSPDIALAVTVKALLLCPSKHEMAQPVMSKLEAMAKLATLQTAETTNGPTQGAKAITPCAEALN